MSGKSTATRRLIRGTAVTWLRLGLAIIAQVVTTPVFLAFWSAETYGIWLAIMTAVALLKLPGASHQTYVGFELLRNWSKRPRLYTRILKSGLRVGYFLSVLELLVAGGIVGWGVPLIIDENSSVAALHEIGAAFFLIAAGGSLVWNWGGIWVRAASATGHYERCAWWGVGDGFIRAVAPLIVIPLGAGLVGAAATLMAALLVLHVLTSCDLIRICRSGLRTEVSGRWSLGLRNLVLSLTLGIKYMLEMIRQQGARLILAPLSGAAEMAAFATMRTGANVALQGLNSITNPLMPELMRFIVARDQGRMEASFATVWLVVLGLMTPVVIVLQAFAPWLFEVWTHGKIPFDPMLFSVLSMSVLVYGAAQPAMAVAQGNNLIRPQLIISFVAGAIALVGMFSLIPRMGIRGAGFALLAAEIAALVGYLAVSSSWLRRFGLVWPWKPFISVAMGALVASITLVLIAEHPQLRILMVMVTLPIEFAIVFWYWSNLPPSVSARFVHAVKSRIGRA